MQPTFGKGFGVATSVNSGRALRDPSISDQQLIIHEFCGFYDPFAHVYEFTKTFTSNLSEIQKPVTKTYPRFRPCAELQICHTDPCISVFPNIYMTINTTYVYQVHRGLRLRFLVSKGSSHK